MDAPAGLNPLLKESRHTDSYLREGAILEFTEAIVCHMDQQGITRKDLARLLGKSPAYVTKILRGNTNFTLDSMVRIAQALGAEFHPQLSMSRLTSSPSGAKSIKRQLSRETR